MSVDRNPLVSVIMPAYNAAAYIDAAIQSILEQTFSDFEFIVIDDCSTDDTEKRIKKYVNSKIVYQKNDTNRGISYTTNKGIECSRGKYIALMDDDDISLPNRLQLQVDYLERHNEIDILGTGGANIDVNGNILAYLSAPKYNPNLYKAVLLFGSVGFLNGSAMMRKQFIEDNRLSYREECLGMQDFMFYMEASKIGNISGIRDVLYYHRNHGKNETDIVLENYRKERAEKYFSIQKESLLRSGFILQNADFHILAKMITEGRPSPCTEQQIDELYCFFKRLIGQAEKMDIDYYDELKYWCKRLLCDRLLRSDIFDNIET